MTGQQWKPGDLATFMVGKQKKARVIAIRDVDETWYGIVLDTGEGFQTRWGSDPEGIQRLMWLNHRDREAIERLRHTLGADHYYGSSEMLAASLREFANPTPPKPDEPTGLGAVVEDTDGQLWINHGNGGWWHEDTGAVRYSLIAAVRVLSEGVTL